MKNNIPNSSRELIKIGIQRTLEKMLTTKTISKETYQKALIEYKLVEPEQTT